MSAFLGPIHHWLFSKIVIVESRAFAIADALKESHGSEVENIIADYGDKLEGKDLGDLVGENPIHNFISGLVAKTAILEGQLVKLGDDQFDIILATATKHGANSASKALETAGKSSVSKDEIAQYVNDNQLEGMPCDPGAQFDPVDGGVRYGHSACNHIANWEFTGVDKSKMCKVVNAWLAGFITGLNPDATIEVVKTIADGSTVCEAKLNIA